MADQKVTTRFQAKDETKGAFSSLANSLSSLKPAAAIGFGALSQLGAQLLQRVQALPGEVRDALQDVAEEFDQLAKESRSLFTTVENLDAMRHAANLAGLSAGDLRKAWVIGSRNISDAADGLASMAENFEKIGVATRDAQGRVRGFEDVLLDVADSLPGMATDTERVAFLMEVFGRSGAQLAPLMEKGAEGIRNAMIEARALGIRTSETTAKAEEYIDAQARWNRSTESLKDILVESTLPALTDFANFIAVELRDAITGTTHEWRTFISTLEQDKSMDQLQLEAFKLRNELAGVEKEIAEYERAWKAGEIQSDFARIKLADLRKEAKRLEDELAPVTDAIGRLEEAERKAREEAEAIAAAEAEAARQADALAEAWGGLTEVTETMLPGLQKVHEGLFQIDVAAEKLADTGLPRIGESYSDLETIVLDGLGSAIPDATTRAFDLMAFEITKDMNMLERMVANTVTAILSQVMRLMLLRTLASFIPGAAGFFGVPGFDFLMKHSPFGRGMTVDSTSGIGPGAGSTFAPSPGGSGGGATVVQNNSYLLPGTTGDLARGRAALRELERVSNEVVFSR